MRNHLRKLYGTPAKILAFVVSGKAQEGADGGRWPGTFGAVGALGGNFRSLGREIQELLELRGLPRGPEDGICKACPMASMLYMILVHILGSKLGARRKNLGGFAMMSPSLKSPEQDADS